MERRPTRIRTTLAGSLLALTLIALWIFGQDPDRITEIRPLAEPQQPSSFSENCGRSWGDTNRTLQHVLAFCNSYVAKQNSGVVGAHAADTILYIDVDQAMARELTLAGNRLDVRRLMDGWARAWALTYWGSDPGYASVTAEIDSVKIVTAEHRYSGVTIEFH